MGLFFVRFDPLNVKEARSFLLIIFIDSSENLHAELDIGEVKRTTRVDALAPVIRQKSRKREFHFFEIEWSLKSEK